MNKKSTIYLELSAAFPIIGLVVNMATGDILIPSIITLLGVPCFLYAIIEVLNK